MFEEGAFIFTGQFVAAFGKHLSGVLCQKNRQKINILLVIRQEQKNNALLDSFARRLLEAADVES